MSIYLLLFIITFLHQTDKVNLCKYARKILVNTHKYLNQFLTPDRDCGSQYSFSVVVDRAAVEEGVGGTTAGLRLKAFRAQATGAKSRLKR